MTQVGLSTTGFGSTLACALSVFGGTSQSHNAEQSSIVALPCLDRSSGRHANVSRHLVEVFWWMIATSPFQVGSSTWERSDAVVHCTHSTTTSGGASR